MYAAAVIPYVHGLPPKLKKAAVQYDINVVFSARNKVGRVCPAVNKLYDEGVSRKTKPTDKAKDTVGFFSN